MISWFYNIDALLRGQLSKDRENAEGDIDFPIVPVIVVSIILAAISAKPFGRFWPAKLR